MADETKAGGRFGAGALAGVSIADVEQAVAKALSELAGTELEVDIASIKFGGPIAGSSVKIRLTASVPFDPFPPSS